MMPTELNSVTIIGGTGTLGSNLLRLITEECPETDITIISRGEHKQALLKREFPKAKFAIADIKEPEEIIPLVSGRDVVFHVAAMKHVDICQDNVNQCERINYGGVVNVAQACCWGRVKHMVFSSTDKAIEPITAYGMAKAQAENFLFTRNKHQLSTKFSVYRWGNVLGSQGSVIHTFIKSLKEEGSIKLTHPEMTRFWIPIDWAVRYMLRTFPNASITEAMVPPNLKSSRVADVADVIAEILGMREYKVEITSIRGEEKIHEAMFWPKSGKYVTSETCTRFSREELKALLEPMVLKEKEPNERAV